MAMRQSMAGFQNDNKLKRFVEGKFCGKAAKFWNWNEGSFTCIYPDSQLELLSQTYSLRIQPSSSREGVALCCHRLSA